MRLDRLRQLPIQEVVEPADISLSISLDVRQAMESLPTGAREVCESLSRSLSIGETARRLGLSWRAVQRELRTIRRRFVELGLADDDADPAEEAAA